MAEAAAGLQGAGRAARGLGGAPSCAPPRPGWAGLYRVPGRGPQSQPAGVQRSPLRLRCWRATRSRSGKDRQPQRGRGEPGNAGRGMSQERGKDGERPGCCAQPRRAPPGNFAGARRPGPPLPSPGLAASAPGGHRGGR